MALFRLNNYFEYRSVSPSSLIQGQLLQFNYKSPDGVIDKRPLVFVYEKRIDRFYGMNLHYEMDHFTEVMQNMNAQIDKYLEEQFKRDSENRKKLFENNNVFSRSLITKQEFDKYMRSFPRKNLESFLIQNPDMDIMRCYLYKRMTGVSKLIWKVK